MTFQRILGLTALLAFPTSAFLPKSLSKGSVWQLGDVIKGEDVDSEPFDIGQGGVRLAQESAIKIVGEVKHKPGQADSRAIELKRYNSVEKLEEGKVNSVLDTIGSKILCTGQGEELYKDPGQTTEKTVLYAPVEAMKVALSSAGPAIDCDNIVFNFLGGEDMVMGEVMDAANQMVVNMDINTKAKVSINSLCHSSIPSGTCTVTVVSVGSNGYDKSNLSGAENSVAEGEVYSRDGSWWTVQESEINTALA